MSVSTWKCRDGRVIPIDELETEHLQNIINMLRRKGAMTPRELANMICHPPQGEAAYDAWSEEIAGAQLSAHLSSLEAELLRRQE
jgi:hypothetical protein